LLSLNYYTDKIIPADKHKKKAIQCIFNTPTYGTISKEKPQINIPNPYIKAIIADFAPFRSLISGFSLNINGTAVLIIL
jgi:hypothetical protein